MSTTPIAFPLFDAMPLAKAISISLGSDIGTINFYEFPDEEISTNIRLPIQNKEVIFIASLDRPNTKLTPLLFSAATARELGAKKIGLIGPDAESSQWVSAIAKIANLPFLILEKIRKGDNLVEVSIPDIEHYKNH